MRQNKDAKKYYSTCYKEKYFMPKIYRSHIEATYLFAHDILTQIIKTDTLSNIYMHAFIYLVRKL